MPACGGPCRCENYADHLRSINFSSTATPTARKPSAKTRPMSDPAWERGKAGERRADGSFMPYLAPGSTRPLGVKEYADNRASYDAQVSTLKSDPDALTHKGRRSS